MGVAKCVGMTTDTAPSNSYLKLLVGTSLVLVVLAALLAQYVQVEQLSTPANTRFVAHKCTEHAVCNISSVQYLQWQYRKDNPYHMTEWVSPINIVCSKRPLPLLQLAANDRPAVLCDTPFDQWKSSQWSPFTLSHKISHILSKKGTENVFKYFAADLPLSAIEEFKEEKLFQEVIFSGETFFELLRQPFDGYYYYASGGMELLDLNDPVYTDELLEMLTFRSHSNAGMGMGQVNFWFGKENVTAYPHYDTSYNLHMMVHGKKQFLLYPPSTLSSRLHPCLHQLYRQPHSEASVEGARYKPIEVVLNPGEVIFIPPFWFHKVVTMTASISVNVWSQSEAFLTMEAVFTSPIPFEEGWGRDRLMSTLNYFIREWINDIFLEDPNDFVRENIFRRYEPLLAKLSEAQVREAVVTVRSYCHRDGESIDDILGSEIVSHIRDQFAKVQRLFSEIHPKSVLKINFANYIEHVTWRILGTHDIVLLPYFLRECFQQHS